MENKDMKFSLSTFVFIFNKDFSKILLIKRNEEKRKKWGFDWGIVGGKIEPGESSIEAIIREISEEVGLSLKAEQLKLIDCEERPSKIHTPGVHFIYSVIIDEEIEIRLNSESDEYDWFKIEELPTSMADSKEKIISVLEKVKTNLLINRINPISWQDFKKVDIRVGTILKAEKFPEARNPAYKLEIDFGELGIRKSSAQITELYKPEQLVGKQIIAVCNFEPKNVAGFMSEVLTMGVVQDDIAILIHPDRKVRNGMRIA